MNLQEQLEEFKTLMDRYIKISDAHDQLETEADDLTEEEYNDRFQALIEEEAHIDMEIYELWPSLRSHIKV